MENLLLYDGVVNYFPNAFSKHQSINIANKLQFAIAWKSDQVTVYGKHYLLNRKAAWYADDAVQYKYSGHVKSALPWTPLLLQIKKTVENITKFSYNSCLLNYYPDGSDGMSWHSDDEKSMKENAAIASVSFGAPRNFYFKHKIDKSKISVLLETGSVLLMHGEVQKHWLHSLPKSKKVNQPRINLTFRTFVNDSSNKNG